MIDFSNCILLRRDKWNLIQFSYKYIGLWQLVEIILEKKDFCEYPNRGQLKFNVMKIELDQYDYYYEPSGQQAMMVANGHNGLHATHPFNLEENFLHILGKTHLIKYTLFEVPREYTLLP